MNISIEIVNKSESYTIIAITNYHVKKNCTKRGMMCLNDKCFCINFVVYVSTKIYIYFNKQ